MKFWHAERMATPRKRRRLVDAYAFPGFRPLATVQGVFGDPKARLITLIRRTKKLSAAAAAWRIAPGTTARGDGYGICRPEGCASTSIWKCGVCRAVTVVP